MKFLIVKEPITDVIEIEAKKAGTINEKTFGTGSEGGHKRQVASDR
ncbi:MAG: hypothetical protein HYV59_16175 [Planctomycetes bacterium]|nr:hypothetical protein [Planctomycetota bacterium]